MNRKLSFEYRKSTQSAGGLILRVNSLIDSLSPGGWVEVESSCRKTKMTAVVAWEAIIKIRSKRRDDGMSEAFTFFVFFQRVVSIALLDYIVVY